MVDIAVDEAAGLSKLVGPFEECLAEVAEEKVAVGSLLGRNAGLEGWCEGSSRAELSSRMMVG